jgi:hypothetical protein
MSAAQSRVDPDLLPQPLPDGWLAPRGRHLGAMVVTYEPYGSRWGPWSHFHPTAFRHLTDCLYAAGNESVTDVYFTSVIKRQGGDLDAAMPFLVEEVQRLVPGRVLAVGQQAFDALTGLDLKLPLYRGIWHRLADPFDWEEGLVLGTWHPQEVLDDPRGKAAQFARDVREFVSAWKRALVV